MVQQQVLPRHETVPADVEIHLRPGRVPPDFDQVLRDEQDVVLADQPSDKIALVDVGQRDRLRGLRCGCDARTERIGCTRNGRRLGGRKRPGRRAGRPSLVGQLMITIVVLLMLDELLPELVLLLLLIERFDNTLLLLLDRFSARSLMDNELSPRIFMILVFAWITRSIFMLYIVHSHPFSLGYLLLFLV